MLRRSAAFIVTLSLMTSATLDAGHAQETKRPMAVPGKSIPTLQPELKSVKQQASYAIGLNIGGQLASDADDIDTDAVIRGIRDSLTKAKPALTDEQIRSALGAFTREMQAKAEAKAEAAGGTNKQAGEAHLAANAKKQGVKTTASGLQYKVIKEGKGATPKATDTVRVHYHGTLIDGTVFDSSVERKEPAEFPVNRVIAGWVEALQLMKVGDKWQLTIPSKLAYREAGTPDGSIGPNSVLVFEVELLDIVK